MATELQKVSRAINWEVRRLKGIQAQITQLGFWHPELAAEAKHIAEGIGRVIDRRKFEYSEYRHHVLEQRKQEKANGKLETTSASDTER